MLFHPSMLFAAPLASPFLFPGLTPAVSVLPDPLLRLLHPHSPQTTT